MIEKPLAKEIPSDKVEIPFKKEEILPKKVDIPTKPVVVLPILYKVREISTLQENKIAEALKESGADSRGQLTALEKILKILKTV
jgi:hypothetical protein